MKTSNIVLNLYRYTFIYESYIYINLKIQQAREQIFKIHISKNSFAAFTCFVESFTNYLIDQKIARTVIYCSQI